MTTLEELTEKILKFRDERDWKQFHKPKDMALSLVLEAAEVLEHFQWKDDAESLRHSVEARSEIAAELSDVLYWILLLAADLEIDLPGAFVAKMAENQRKYPVETARGSSKKYST